MPRTVLFIGDSHTRARLGSSYVEKLQHMLQNSDLQLLKFGVDGEPTESIARRVGPILKKHPRPAAVFLLAGTNDCIAQEHPTMQWMYRKGFKTTRPCSLDYALGNMKQMLEHVRKEAPDAKVTVITIPPVAEDPCCPAHQRVEQYNVKLKQMVDSNFPAVRIADYYTAAIRYLQEHSPAYKQYQPLAEGAAPAQQPADLSTFTKWFHSTYTFSMVRFIGQQLLSLFKRRIFGVPWNDISKSRGLCLLTDWVHMNDTAAGLLAEVLLPYVRDLR